MLRVASIVAFAAALALSSASILPNTVRQTVTADAFGDFRFAGFPQSGCANRIMHTETDVSGGRVPHSVISHNRKPCNDNQAMEIFGDPAEVIDQLEDEGQKALIQRFIDAGDDVAGAIYGIEKNGRGCQVTKLGTNTLIIIVNPERTVVLSDDGSLTFRQGRRYMVVDDPNVAGVCQYSADLRTEDDPEPEDPPVETTQVDGPNGAPVPVGDAGDTGGDTGSVESGGDGEDTGSDGEDAGSDGEDAGSDGEDAGSDGEDAGSDGEDAGGDGEDAGSDGEDAGGDEDTGGEDAGGEDEDTGGEDAGGDEDTGGEAEDAGGEGTGAGGEGSGDGGDGGDEANVTSTPDDDDDDVCFPADATVELEDGSLKSMVNVQIGDRVKVADGVFSDVYMFTHKDSSSVHDFVRITTASGATIEATKGHYIYINNRFAAAMTAKTGDVLELGDGARSTVRSVSTVEKTGLYNPQTVHGDIIVNSVRASTFTRTIEPVCAQAMLAPLRMIYRTFGWSSSMLDNGADMIAKMLPRGEKSL